MRNPNGFGSVYKVKRKLRKPWVVKVSTNEKGRLQTQKLLGYFATKTEALEKLIEYQKNPKFIDNQTITIERVFKMWLEEKGEKVSKKRLQAIQSLYKSQIKKIDTIAIVKFTPIFCQNFMNELQVSSGTKTAIKSILNGVFKYAQKMEIITTNPAELIEIGKHQKVVERKIFTELERAFLWNNTAIEMVQHVLILIYTGLRINEYLKLNLEDYNQDNDTIRTGSKTQAGMNRIVPVHSKIKGFLLEILETKANKKSYEFFRVRFNKFCDEHKELQKHTIHDTRHTFASLMNTAGANTVAITQIIGHTDIKTTNSIYTHKEIEELKKAIEMI